MGIWSRDDDAVERMDTVVTAYRADLQERHDMLRGQVAAVVGLLRSSANTGGMDADVCSELAELLDGLP
jgi:hypothetical protein